MLCTGCCSTDIRNAGVDHVVHLGDLTCGGGYFDMDPAEFAEQLHCLFSDYASLGQPVHALPGNHDCPPGGDWSLFESLWGLGSGLGSTIDLGGARLLLINAQGHSAQQIEAALPEDPVFGWVNEAELQRIESALATAQDRPVIVGIHQLLRPWVVEVPYLDFFSVRNADAVLDLLARAGNVRAVFQGHAHFYEVQNVPLGSRSVPFVITPAVIEYPAAWLLLEIEGGALRVEVRRLPISSTARNTMLHGSDQSWRDGRPEWQRFTIPL